METGKGMNEGPDAWHRLTPRYDRYGDLIPPPTRRDTRDEFERTARILTVLAIYMLTVNLANLFAYAAGAISNPIPGILLGTVPPAIIVLIRVGWEETRDQ